MLVERNIAMPIRKTCIINSVVSNGTPLKWGIRNLFAVFTLYISNHGTITVINLPEMYQIEDAVRIGLI